MLECVRGANLLDGCRRCFRSDDLGAACPLWPATRNGDLEGGISREGGGAAGEKREGRLGGSGRGFATATRQTWCSSTRSRRRKPALVLYVSASTLKGWRRDTKLVLRVKDAGCPCDQVEMGEMEIEKENESR